METLTTQILEDHLATSLPLLLSEASHQRQLISTSCSNGFHGVHNVSLHLTNSIRRLTRTTAQLQHIYIDHRDLENLDWETFPSLRCITVIQYNENLQEAQDREIQISSALRDDFETLTKVKRIVHKMINETVRTSLEKKLKRLVWRLEEIRVDLQVLLWRCWGVAVDMDTHDTQEVENWCPHLTVAARHERDAYLIRNLIVSILLYGSLGETQVIHDLTSFCNASSPSDARGVTFAIHITKKKMLRLEEMLKRLHQNLVTSRHLSSLEWEAFPRLPCFSVFDPINASSQYIDNRDTVITTMQRDNANFMKLSWIANKISTEETSGTISRQLQRLAWRLSNIVTNQRLLMDMCFGLSTNGLTTDRGSYLRNMESLWCSQSSEASRRERDGYFIRLAYTNSIQLRKRYECL